MFIYKKITAFILTALLIISMLLSLLSCVQNETSGAERGSCTYKDALSVISANWNPHTYQTTDESYPIEYITMGLYSFFFNDDINPVDEKEPYTSYVIMPEMAADYPRDVTKEIKESKREYNIPASADSGYAYTIKLNKNAKWENGEAINADTYVYSMRQLLDPALSNYRATDYYSGNFCIAGAELYANQGKKNYPEEVSFDTVGIYKSGEFEITLVFEKAIAGFQLLYALTRNWIVYEPYYEEGKKKIEGTDAYASTYSTSLSSTMSYGPYKMTSYDIGKSMTFEKNTNWYGYSDGKHIYKDPEDGKVYPMYQTTRIEAQYVKEAGTRKLMFLKGELMTYAPGSDDFSEYRDSEYSYVTPRETVFFFIFNGDLKTIKKREEASDFDRSKKDLETMTLKSFRRAIALSYDKEALAAELSPSRRGGYGLIGNSYIYDADNLLKYRDTDEAKRALCEFYSVDLSKHESLDDAVDSITGYDPVTAREYFISAFNEALALGYITNSNNAGISDQVAEITYSVSESTEFIKKTIAYLNEKIKAITTGTPFENRIQFVESAPLGAPGWSNNLKAGLTDTVLAGWSGSALDPYGLTDLYVNPSYQYDAGWFDSSALMLELEVNTSARGSFENEEKLTMSLREWSDALNGATVTVNEKEYCFGDGVCDTATRLKILAGIESAVLQTYNYIPMLQDASMLLLSRQAYYVTEDNNAVLGLGGIKYLKYNYDDAEWASYVARMGGELKY